MSPTNTYLIAYDIKNDHRRTKIAQYLQRHGEREQYSVFIITGKLTRITTITHKLTTLMDTTEDSIIICTYTEHKRLGRKKANDDEHYIY